jgi:hypothetical protein
MSTCQRCNEEFRAGPYWDLEKLQAARIITLKPATLAYTASGVRIKVPERAYFNSAWQQNRFSPVHNSRKYGKVLRINNLHWNVEQGRNTWRIQQLGGTDIPCFKSKDHSKADKSAWSCEECIIDAEPEPVTRRQRKRLRVQVPDLDTDVEEI